MEDMKTIGAPEMNVIGAPIRSSKNIVITPDVKYESYAAESGDTSIDDILPAEGAKDTIYRVASWDGTQVDATKSSEYVWDGEDYILLRVLEGTIGDGVFDISSYNASGGTLATYADLAAALGTNGANVPEGVRKGGMSVKFVHSDDNKYVQYLYHGTSTAVGDFTNVNNWEKMNLEEEVSQLEAKVGEVFDYSVEPSNITWIRGKYISMQGVLTDNLAYCYTSPVPIKKGELAVVYTTSYLYAAISKTDSIGSSYVPVVNVKTSPGSLDNLFKYEYLSDEDGYVAFSGFWIAKAYAYIAKAGTIFAYRQEVSLLEQKTNEVLDYSVAPSAVTWIRGKYISITGVLSPNNDYGYTEPVPIKKGELAVIHVASYLFAAISKTDSNGSSYIPVVIVETSQGPTGLLHTYKYLAKEDGYVAFSGYFDYGYAYIIKKDSLTSLINQDIDNINQDIDTLDVKVNYVLGNIPYDILDNKAVSVSPYGDIADNSSFDTIVADVENAGKVKLVLQKNAFNTGYALYSDTPSHSTIIGNYKTIGNNSKKYTFNVEGAKFLVICFGISSQRYQDVRELYPILIPEESEPKPGIFWNGINIFEPFRTVVGRAEYLYKNSIVAGMSPSTLTSIHTTIVRQHLQDYSSKALEFVADEVGEYPIVINVRTPDLEIISKTITISVKEQPAKKLVNKNNLRVIFFGDSLIYANYNLIGAEWLRMLNTDDSQTVVNSDGSIQLPTLNATDGKIQMYGDHEHYPGVKYTMCGSAQTLCEAKTDMNPFYNPNSEQPDELGPDGINKRVDFGWWFDNNIGVGEYPELVYMALGPNDFAVNWSEVDIEPTTNRVVAICKKIKSVCDSRAGGNSGTVIKIIQHQPYAMQGNPLYNFPPLMQRVLWQKTAAAYVSALKNKGMDTYAELIPCASRFDIDLSYDLREVNNNTRYNGPSDKHATQTIHMNRLGAYNYADVLITDFLADSRFD